MHIGCRNQAYFYLFGKQVSESFRKWTKGDDEAIQILESQVTNKKVRVGDKVEFVKEYKFRDPRELALKAMLEIRGQLNLQLEIFKTLYDLKAMKESHPGRDRGGGMRLFFEKETPLF